MQQSRHASLPRSDLGSTVIVSRYEDRSDSFPCEQRAVPLRSAASAPVGPVAPRVLPRGPFPLSAERSFD
ncbi:MAG TPA: hypothetical protein DCQ98_07985 [Planctomycetaceae bacterium]|nr:hypothetical protein [Planctomycetaceae bacterium]